MSVSTRTSPLWRRFIDFSVPICAFNAFPRTNGESLVSGWSESLDSITNHLTKLEFESPSVSESSDAGHDLLCCCLVADDVEFLVFMVLMKFSTCIRKRNEDEKSHRKSRCLQRRHHAYSQIAQEPFFSDSTVWFRSELCMHHRFIRQPHNR